MLLGSGSEEHLGHKIQHPAEKTGDKAHQQCGDECSLPHASQMPRQQEGKDHCDHRHGDVKADLGGAEVRFPGHDNGPYKGLARQHGHVTQYFQIHTESQHHAADEQIRHLHRIGLGIYERQKSHGHVDEIAECHRNGDLQQMLQLKVFPQDQQLQQNQQQTERNGKLP